MGGKYATLTHQTDPEVQSKIVQQSANMGRPVGLKYRHFKTLASNINQQKMSNYNMFNKAIYFLKRLYRD